MSNIKRGMITLSSLNGATVLELPNPHMEGDSGGQQHATFVNQGRNTQAEVIAQKIGRDQVKLNLAWSWLPTEEWQAIVQFFDKNFFFNCKYFDDVAATFVTRRFYVGDRSGRPLNVNDSGEPTFGYVQCTANLIDTGGGV